MNGDIILSHREDVSLLSSGGISWQTQSFYISKQEICCLISHYKDYDNSQKYEVSDFSGFMWRIYQIFKQTLKDDTFSSASAPFIAYLSGEGVFNRAMACTQGNEEFNGSYTLYLKNINNNSQVSSCINYMKIPM